MSISEAELIPYHASPVPDARAVLVFAPHPDDEVFGCGGTLAQHVQAGHAVHVILLTDGGHGADDESTSDVPGYAEARLQESAEAAHRLGLEPPGCWGLIDRNLRYGEDLIDRMRQALHDTGADVVYAPSPWELHPDHRATALAALETIRRHGLDATLYLYEVSAPLRPNRLVNITAVWADKRAAMEVFASQERKLPYASFVSALNRFRALTLQPGVEYAEGFEMVRGAELRAGGSLLIESMRDRLLAQGVAAVPDDAPLVSVIVRSMGRPTLDKALASVALQTHTHLEVVVVDAAGHGLPQAVAMAAPVACRVVSTGQPLGRAAAANAGLRAAAGDYLVFLDDDDWFYPDHVAKLVRATRSHPELRAVHTAVECVDGAARPLGEVFDFPYATGELRYGNFLPIHSVLFHRSLLDEGCAFDPCFDLYEDWDFWLQVEACTPLGFVSGVSAAYRIQAGSGEGVRVDAQRARTATAQLYSKWRVLQSEQTFDELITRALSRRSLLRRVDQCTREVQQQTAALATQQQQAMAALQDADRARQDAHHLRMAHDQACADRDAARHDHAAALRDWACTSQQLAATHTHWAEEHGQRLAAEAQAAEAARALAQVQAELQLTHNHARNLQQALDLSQQALDLSQRNLTALLASRSWRWTQPLRQAHRGLRVLGKMVAAVRIARRQGMGWTALTTRTWSVIRREGLDGLRARVRRKLQPAAPAAAPDAEGGVPGAAAGPAPARDYAAWVHQHDTLGPDERDALQVQVRQLPRQPLVSLVMPVYKPQAEDLLRAIASVQAQVYPHWELCICDDASPQQQTRELLQAQAAQDPRIRLVLHERNQHISHATNSALALARGELIGFLDHDDELRPHALLCAVQAFETHPEAGVLYSDEDKIDAQGRRFDPYFKPDFNLGLLRSHNYMCHFAVYRRTLMDRLGGVRPGFEGAQDYDLALRAVDVVGARGVIHVPKVLYHWRTATGSTAAGHDNKAYAFEAGRQALMEHLQRRGLHADVVQASEAPGMYRLAWTRPEPAPRVSIVIPTRNGHDILKMCLDSLCKTAYPNYEVIVVDNGSDDPATLDLLSQRTTHGQIRVLRDDRAFNFSALNNHAVREMAHGEFILMMNNDIEVTHPEWLDEMVGPAMEPGVGCVGARLWYPDGRLQHGGVVLVCGVAGHAHKLLPKGHHGYMGRAVLAQDFVAVTAACLLVRRSVFDEVGGLDEGLAVAFNDVDFCLRVHQAGYRNHWTPYAELVHHESVSRGYEDTPEKQRRFQREIDTLQARWSALLKRDPCYSPNLTADAEDFSLAWPPRVRITDPCAS